LPGGVLSWAWSSFLEILVEGDPLNDLIERNPGLGLLLFEISDLFVPPVQTVFPGIQRGRVALQPGLFFGAAFQGSPIFAQPRLMLGHRFDLALAGF
jgi:hypothetical protein